MNRERLASVDAAWLRMDDDTQRMMITVLLRFEGTLSFAQVETLVRERVLVHPRFRQRVVDSVIPGVGPSWEEDPHFALPNHLHKAALPAPKDDGALIALASDLASSALDPRSPLWQMHVVEDSIGGTTLIARLHHAIGDGISLVHFLLSLTDECQHAVPPTVGLQLGHVPRAFRDLAKVAVDHAVTLARLLALPFDPPTRFRGELGREKRVAFSPPFPVAELKHAGAKAGAKLNDVLLAAAGGAMRRYLLANGDRADDLELRALVPVFFQGHGDTAHLGNHFGLVFAPLLVGIDDPLARLAEVKRRMDALKGASDAVVSLEVLELMGVAGASAERIGIDVFTRKASAMITNVPGPPTALHLAGRPLADMVVWAPVAGHVGLGISLLSYGGNIRVGVIADANRVPDPMRFVEAFVDEVAALRAT